MAKKPREGPKTDGWKDTYGDMVTLLLCFFVLLYSMSAVDQEKWQAFVKAFTNPGEDTAQVVLVPSEELGDHTVPGENSTEVGGSTEDTIENIDDLYEALKEFVEEQGMQDSVEIAEGEGVVYVRYQNSLFFKPDSAELLPSAMPSLEFLGDSLKQLEDQLWLVSISGHTASVAYDNYAVSDWDLSAMRATSVAKHFEEDSGLDPMILRPIGFGKNYPIADNSTAEGRERNRRVELVIISRDSPLAQSDAVAGAVSGLFDADVYEAESNGITSIEDVLDPSDVLDGLLDAESTPADADAAQDADATGTQDGTDASGAAADASGTQDDADASGAAADASSAPGDADDTGAAADTTSAPGGTDASAASSTG